MKCNHFRKGEIALKTVALSTADNPFNPITEFDPWYQYDISHGYNSSQYVANIADMSDEMFGREQIMKNKEEAIDRIIYLFPGMNFIKVVQEN